MKDERRQDIKLSPIGYIHTKHNTKFSTPHQPLPGSDEERATIELLPGHNFEQALKDLAGFERVWIIWCFHKNTEWNPQVRPPRGKTQKRGVFATRSPHRPNPIGMTPVRLLSVKGRCLVIGESDLLDGTPILDIKPYIPKYDSFPDAIAGWVSEVDEQTEAKMFTVEIRNLARQQLDWLKEHDIELEERVIEILSVDPTPHRTRRITKSGERFRIASGAWRIFFSIDQRVVSILEVRPGYSTKSLSDPSLTEIADRQAQLEFGRVWAA